MKDESIILAKNLKELRLKQNLSQSDLAKLLNVNKSFISNLESGKTNPTLQTIASLAKAVGVDTNELLK